MVRGRVNKTKSQRANHNRNVQAIVRRTLANLQERKVSSVQVSGATVNTAGAIVPLTTQIVEGDDINMRSGTKIHLKRMHFRFTARMNTDDQSMRFIIFRDKMNTGTFPTVTEVLPTTGYLSHFSDTREIQQRRYSILLDETLDVSVAGPSRVCRKAEIHVNANVFYNAATNVTAANGKGACFLLVIGSHNTGLFDYDWQGEYTDS